MSLQPSPAPHSASAIAAESLALIAQARISDFIIERDDKEKVTSMSCTANGIHVKAIAGPERDRESWVERVELRRAEGATLGFDARDEASEHFAQQIGNTLWNQRCNLVTAAQSAGLDAVKKFLRPGSPAESAHLCDITFERNEKGEREVRAVLVVSDLVIEPREPVHLSLVTEAVQITPRDSSAPPGQSVHNGTTTFELRLTELHADAPTPRADRAIEMACTMRGEGTMYTRSTTGAALFYALYADPALASAPAVPLGRVAEKIQKAGPSERLLELGAVRERLRHDLLGHFSFASPTERADLQTGDVVAHVMPSIVSPGLQLQVYRIKEIALLDEEPDAGIAVEIVSEGVAVSKEFWAIPKHEKYFRRIEDCELPEGGGGLASVSFDHDLLLTRISAKRWDTLGGSERHSEVEANNAETSMDIAASVNESVFHWEAHLESTYDDPFVGPILRSLGELPVAIFPPKDDCTLASECGHRDGFLDRRVLGIPSGSFSAPGYWVLPEGIVAQFAKHARLLSECSEAEVAALHAANAKGEIC